MYWNNDYKKPIEDEDVSIVVHELASEVSIVGGASFNNGNILVGPLVEDNLKPLYYTQIKIKHDKNGTHIKTPVSRTGYYHIDGIAGEFSSLMSLHFRTRFYHSSTVGGELSITGAQWRTNFMTLRIEQPIHIDTEVFAGKTRNYETFEDFMALIDKIPEKYHRQIISAASNYNLALREIGIDHEMVFVRLVSAIEAFSNNFELDKQDDLLMKLKTDDLVRRLDDYDKEEFLTMFNSRKSSIKFIRFLETYSKGFFKGGRASAKHTKIHKSQLYEVAKSIYNARSRYLHEGERMYLSQSFAGIKYDTDPSTGMYIGNKKFVEKEKMPNIEFFEGLVRHCLLNKIQELAQLN